MATHYTIEHYMTEDGEDVFSNWFDALHDTNAKARIAMRLNRMALTNFGGHKPLDHGVWELRIDYGPGYRVYYCLDGRTVVLLLCGGDKTSRKADLAKAKGNKKDYEKRKKP
jgi:putative addiction module killer protein